MGDETDYNKILNEKEHQRETKKLQKGTKMYKKRPKNAAKKL